jgi:hypothetical protein
MGNIIQYSINSPELKELRTKIDKETLLEEATSKTTTVVTPTLFLPNKRVFTLSRNALQACNSFIKGVRFPKKILRDDVYIDLVIGGTLVDSFCCEIYDVMCKLTPECEYDPSITEYVQIPMHLLVNGFLDPVYHLVEVYFRSKDLMEEFNLSYDRFNGGNITNKMVIHETYQIDSIYYENINRVNLFLGGSKYLLISVREKTPVVVELPKKLDLIVNDEHTVVVHQVFKLGNWCVYDTSSCDFSNCNVKLQDLRTDYETSIGVCLKIYVVRRSFFTVFGGLFGPSKL